MDILLKVMLAIGAAVLLLWFALAWSTWRYIEDLRKWRNE